MDEHARARLRWRCRRGMRELDLLLSAWLEERWPAAGADERRSFQWLLDQSDPDLAAWLFRSERPADAAHAALIDDILRLRR